MSFARIAGFVLAGLLIGVPALNAQEVKPGGGDGGVVILPFAAPITDEFSIESPDGTDGDVAGGDVAEDPTSDGIPLGDAGQTRRPEPSQTPPSPMLLSFSLRVEQETTEGGADVRDEGEGHEGENDNILIALPGGMVDPRAIMLAGEQGVQMAVTVVANHLEIDRGVLRSLHALSVERLEILVVSTNGLFVRMSVVLEANKATFTID